VRYVGPVYLLTSDVTVSAAEILALYLRALPKWSTWANHSRRFLDMIEKPLPNGWTLTLSAEVSSRSAGRSYESARMPPQREFGCSRRCPDGRAAHRVLALMDENRLEVSNGTAGGGRPPPFNSYGDLPRQRRHGGRRGGCRAVRPQSRWEG